MTANFALESPESVNIWVMLIIFELFIRKIFRTQKNLAKTGKIEFSWKFATEFLKKENQLSVQMRKKIKNGGFGSRNRDVSVLDRTSKSLWAWNEITNKEENRSKAYWKDNWDTERDACGRVFDSEANSELDPEVEKFFRTNKSGFGAKGQGG